MRALIWLAGALWGALVFMLVLQLSFPSGAASERLNYEVDQRTGGAWLVQSESVGPWRFTGASLEQLEIFSVPRTRRGDAPPPSRLLQASRASARLQLLPLLRGAIGVALDAELYDGELGGSIAQSESELEVALAGSGLDLNLYPFGGESWGLDAGGRMDLRIDLTHDMEEAENSFGEIAMNIDGFTLSNIEVMGFKIDKVATFSESELLFKVADGKATVKTGKFNADILELELDGHIELDEQLGRSKLKLELIVGILDEDLSQMASLAPNLKRAEDKEGRYHFRITGTIERPRFSEDAQNSRRRERATRGGGEDGEPRGRPGNEDGPRPGLDAGPRRFGGADGPPTPLGGRPMNEVDDEERARIREERLSSRRERRDRMRQEREDNASDPPLDFEDELDPEDFEDEDFEDEDFEDEDFEDFDELQLPNDLPYLE